MKGSDGSPRFTAELRARGEKVGNRTGASPRPGHREAHTGAIVAVETPRVVGEGIQVSGSAHPIGGVS